MPRTLFLRVLLQEPFESKVEPVDRSDDGNVHIFLGHPSRGFDGYVDKKATEKKIVRGVQRHGDLYFRSGDLLYADEFGWMYFMDRMGDTYRLGLSRPYGNEILFKEKVLLFIAVPP